MEEGRPGQDYTVLAGVVAVVVHLLPEAGVVPRREADQPVAILSPDPGG